MTSPKLKVHVLYECSDDRHPHGCGVIRLLRPLAHPSLRNSIELSSGADFPSFPVDVVILERLLDQTCDWPVLRARLQALRSQGTRIVAEIDDDLLSLNLETGTRNWPSEAQKMWLRQVLRFADGIIVSTQNLAARLKHLNRRIEIVGNALDESLFAAFRQSARRGGAANSLVFGYMGTLTHLDDLLSIIHPLRRMLALHKDRVRFEIVGIADHALLGSVFAGLPVSFLSPPMDEVRYELFTQWVSRNIRWDFGIAPLLDSTFSRSKSDIKFLDYGVMGTPGIFSDVASYSTTVKHLINGLLAQDPASWESCLHRIITDDAVRLDMARKAHGYVWSERMLEHTAIKWDDAIRRIVNTTPGN